MKRKKSKPSPSDLALEKIGNSLPEVNDGMIAADVLGSYTGVPVDGDEPVQDADDL